MHTSGDPLVLINAVFNNSKGRFALASLIAAEYSKYKNEPLFVIGHRRWFQDLREFRRLPSDDPVCVLIKSMQGHSNPLVDPSLGLSEPISIFYFRILLRATKHGEAILQSGQLAPGIQLYKGGRTENHFITTTLKDIG